MDIQGRLNQANGWLRAARVGVAILTTLTTYCPQKLFGSE